MNTLSGGLSARLPFLSIINKKIRMTSLKKKFVLSLTLFFSSLPIAHAERPGWYIGLQGGYANTHMKVEDLVT